MQGWCWKPSPTCKDRSCSELEHLPTEQDLAGKTIARVEPTVADGHDATRLVFTDGTEWVFINLMEEEDEDCEWDESWDDIEDDDWEDDSDDLSKE